MSNRTGVVRLLKKEQDRLTNELRGIGAALAAFGNAYGNGTATTFSSTLLPLQSRDKPVRAWRDWPTINRPMRFSGKMPTQFSSAYGCSVASTNPSSGLADILFRVVTSKVVPECRNQVGQSNNDDAAITDGCDGILTSRAAKLGLVRKFECEHGFF